MGNWGRILEYCSELYRLSKKYARKEKRRVSDGCEAR